MKRLYQFLIIFTIVINAFMVVGCEDATDSQRIAFAQKHFNTSEVEGVGSGSADYIIRDQSNQVWRVTITGKPAVRSAILIFPAEQASPPFYPMPPTPPVEPIFNEAGFSNR